MHNKEKLKKHLFNIGIILLCLSIIFLALTSIWNGKIYEKERSFDKSIDSIIKLIIYQESSENLINQYYLLEETNPNSSHKGYILGKIKDLRIKCLITMYSFNTGDVPSQELAKTWMGLSLEELNQEISKFSDPDYPNALGEEIDSSKKKRNLFFILGISFELLGLIFLESGKVFKRD